MTDELDERIAPPSDADNSSIKYTDEIEYPVDECGPIGAAIIAFCTIIIILSTALILNWN